MKLCNEAVKTFKQKFSFIKKKIFHLLKKSFY